MRTTAVIVDDEEHCRVALSGLLERRHPEIELVGMASSVPEGIDLVNTRKPKILFLDIEIGKQTASTCCRHWVRTART